MPALALKPQGLGQKRTFLFDLVGADFYHEAVDDSDGTSHDGNGSYFTMGLGPSQSKVSLVFFEMSERVRPVSISVNVAATRSPFKGPLQYQIGFCRGSEEGFDATTIVTDDAYAVSTRTFTANPITGQPWAESDLDDLEVCLNGVTGEGRISLVSVSPMTYERAYLRSHMEPHAAARAGRFRV